MVPDETARVSNLDDHASGHVWSHYADRGTRSLCKSRSYSSALTFRLSATETIAIIAEPMRFIGRLLWPGTCQFDVDGASGAQDRALFWDARIWLWGCSACRRVRLEHNTSGQQVRAGGIPASAEVLMERHKAALPQEIIFNGELPRQGNMADVRRFKRSPVRVRDDRGGPEGGGGAGVHTFFRLGQRVTGDVEQASARSGTWNRGTVAMFIWTEDRASRKTCRDRNSLRTAISCHVVVTAHLHHIAGSERLEDRLPISRAMREAAWKSRTTRHMFRHRPAGLYRC